MRRIQRLCGGGIRGWLSGTADEQNRQRDAAVAAMRECVRFAADQGVTLLIEPINRYETNFINTAAEGLALLDEICEPFDYAQGRPIDHAQGRPSAKLLLDTFHMNIEEADMTAALRTAGDRLGYVHVADSNRRAPGQGHLDFLAVQRALNDVGYSGVVTAQILPVPDDLSAIRQAGGFLTSLLERDGR